MDILKILISCLWVIWLLFWFFSSFRTKKNIRTNWSFTIILRIAIIIVVILFLHIPVFYQFVVNIHTYSFYENPIISGIGFIIFLFGFAVSIGARVSLGNNWGMPMTLKEKPELIVKGPYAFIRHPIYTGMILAMLGTAITVSIFWLIPFIFLTMYFIYSMLREEQDMLHQFPKQYPAYKKRTKALIPFIY